MKAKSLIANQMRCTLNYLLSLKSPKFLDKKAAGYRTYKKYITLMQIAIPKYMDDISLLFAFPMKQNEQKIIVNKFLKFMDINFFRKLATNMSLNDGKNLIKNISIAFGFTEEDFEELKTSVKQWEGDYAKSGISDAIKLKGKIALAFHIRTNTVLRNILNYLRLNKKVTIYQMSIELKLKEKIVKKSIKKLEKLKLVKKIIKPKVTLVTMTKKGKRLTDLLGFD